MIGHIISHFHILEKLGEGGMGVVYKAEDTHLKRTVALKFLPPELTRDPEAKERFIHEAKAASALDHNNICNVHEIAEADDGQIFIVMACYEGETLKSRIAKGQLRIEEATDIAIQIAQGLAEAHDHGIVHRDIKPANVLITKNGVVKIVDFGLAKLSGASKLTKQGSTLGTVAYMSPEQARGDNVDHRTDIWSLGIILYEMLTARLPFRGEHDAAMLYSIVNEEPESLQQLLPGISLDIVSIVNRALQKEPAARYSSVEEMLTELKALQGATRAEEGGFLSRGTILTIVRKPRVAIPALVALAGLCILAFWFFDHQTKTRWAKDVLLPQIAQILNDETECRDNFVDAYRHAQEAERYLPHDTTLARLMARCSVTVSIRTVPAGASVYLKQYTKPDTSFEYIGVTPIENIRMPMGIFRWKVEKEDYVPLLVGSPTFKVDRSDRRIFMPLNFSRVLDKNGDLPEGMVRVPRGDILGNIHLGDFFIDKYEVTNKQFKSFVDNGGYEKRELWVNKFTKDGRTLNWDAAMADFVDQTKRPGPSTWQAGTYPNGQEDYPVSGISWYEAAAYARFVGKTLPTQHHWEVAKGIELSDRMMYFFASIIAFSNFNGTGPVSVGSLSGMTSSGAMDMAGNVREWCWNETSRGRLLRGGAWDDAAYLFQDLSQASAFDRSPRNGFRCALCADSEKTSLQLFQAAIFPERNERDIVKEKPVPESVFEAYKNQFSYDKANLHVARELLDESATDWIQERITFDAAYHHERVTAFLFLPKNAKPPYQTVLYFPGASSQQQPTRERMDDYREFRINLSFLLSNGRAVIYPIYKGTFGRGLDAFEPANPSRRYSEYLTCLVKDVKRSIDFLETRPEIDKNKIAYLGFSWGGRLGAIMPAVESRLKISILKVGGLGSAKPPESDEMTYITRVKIPTLMLNGKYDMDFSYEMSAKPMFELLGTPKGDKLQKVYETDHYVPNTEFMKETLAWLDKYFGRPAK